MDSTEVGFTHKVWRTCQKSEQLQVQWWLQYICLSVTHKDKHHAALFAWENNDVIPSLTCLSNGVGELFLAAFRTQSSVASVTAAAARGVIIKQKDDSQSWVLAFKKLSRLNLDKLVGPESLKRQICFLLTPLRVKTRTGCRFWLKVSKTRK